MTFSPRPPKLRGDRAWAKDRTETPLSFFQALDAEFAFAFDAACDSSNCLCPMGAMVDHGRDGLLEPWASPAWCNPPYSRVRSWVEKAILVTVQVAGAKVLGKVVKGR